MWRIYRTPASIHLGFQLASRLWSSIWSPSGRSGKSQGVGDIWALGGGGRSLEVRIASPGLMRNQETLESVNKSQHTAFHCAAREGHLKVVQFLLSQAGKCRKNLQKSDFKHILKLPKIQGQQCRFRWFNVSKDIWDGEACVYQLYDMSIGNIHTGYLYIYIYIYTYYIYIYINCCPLAWPSLVVFAANLGWYNRGLLRGAPPGHHVDVPIADSLAFGFREAAKSRKSQITERLFYAQEIRVLRYILYIYIHLLIIYTYMFIDHVIYSSLSEY